MNEDLLDQFQQVESFHWWWSGRRALIKFLIGNRVPKKILDIGCGTGQTFNFLHEQFPKAKLYGMDSSAKAVRYVIKNGYKNVKKGSANRLPYPNQSFDLILFLDVLEHIQDHQKAINEAKRVLIKGGRIIITAPALKFIWSDHDRKQYHFRRYSVSELKDLARNSELKLEFISYFNFFLSPVIIVFRLLGNLKPFANLNQYNSSFNYDIAHKKFTNRILERLFTTEIAFLRIVRYPFGISIAAMYEKP